MVRKGVLMLLFVCGALFEGFGQCAMCRTQLENNFSNGDPGIAAGINLGILYLLAMPYLAIILLGFLWYKSSKNARRVALGHSSR